MSSQKVVSTRLLRLPRLLHLLATGFVLAALFLLVAPPAAADAAAGTMRVVPWHQDGTGFEDLKDPARPVLDLLSRGDLGRGTNLSKGAVSGLLDEVFTVEHRVPVGDGQTLAVTETFTLRSWLNWPHRAVLFLNGSAFRGNHFSIPVEGYDGTAMAARRGLFAFTVDYLGVGDSSKPADGRDASFEAQTEAMRTLVRYIRFFRAVPRVDLLGEGYGGSIATQLAADAGRIRSCSMSAMLYDTLIGGPLTDPAFVAILEGSPDGYFFVPGEGSLIFMEEAPQAVKDYVVATQGGFYPTPNFLVAAYGLPFFDPGVARVPGLVLFGPNDIVVGPHGVDQLVLDYGTDGATLAVTPLAGHAPRTESPAITAWFWDTFFSFIGL